MKGRSKISDATMQDVMDRVASGESLKGVCRDKGICHMSVYRRTVNDERWREEYLSARAAQADAHADEIMDCARKVMRGELGAAEGRVAIDAYKWTASKLKPQSYGDRMEYNIKGEVNLVSILEKFDAIDVTPEKPLLESREQG